ncbi:exopolysaccharide biosynthesis polyprenyl glycosylphosphotransferase [Brevundimonas sp.]|uniref:exopolysaccharide biosynthesis polyprenyl glycosylphosphotransferase n=1 Tax=Brevundimonas sp. TaxID=1871086 RepID=UPI0025E39B57|nr:exopolysaccharide biosynthesis polyprenyl glycosylphosphotransferase [Brevundimonas sp.]
MLALKDAEFEPVAGDADAGRTGASESDPHTRRGPFRPERLVTARERQTERLSSFYFRALDLLAVTGWTLMLALAIDGAPLAAPTGQILPVAIGAWAALSLMRTTELYRFGRGERVVVHLAKLWGAFGLAGGLAAAVATMTGHASALPEIAIWAVAGALITSCLHLLWWRMVREWRAQGRLTPSIAIVGATKHAERLIKDALKRRDINVLGVFDDRLGRAPETVAGVPVLGDLDSLLSHKIAPYLDRIVVAVDPAARQRVAEITKRLAILPNEVSLIVDQDDQAGRDEALARLAEAPLAPVGGPPDPDRRAFAKRMQDLLAGGLLLIGLAPMMAMVALLVKLDSPGPIFFRQRRHGFNNEEILVWKFRTMRHEAADATASRQVTADDDRITRLGRFLRKTSIDELPQLLNVVRGEMSLVGPRPHAVGMKTGETESARLVAEYAHRHRMKPGMTGWAAIKGSRGPLHTAADVRRRVQLDVDYIERQSFWLDIWIILVTAPVLLGDRSAVR